MSCPSSERPLPNLVFANSKGEILDYDGLKIAGASAGDFYCPSRQDLIELPEGSELFVLPDRLPVGIEADTGEPALLESNPFAPGEAIQAVAAFMAPAHTAVYTAAYQKQNSGAPLLPLFAYTAVGWMDGKFYVTAFRSDADIRQDPIGFNQDLINKKTAIQLADYPKNRLIQHLGKCCLTYGCPAARNYFLERWEAPLPCSPICNAACLGCISLQPSGCCPSTQDRIQFVPSAAEIAEIAVPHLNSAMNPVVSFGQGCEGEPLLQAETIKRAIELIRKQTTLGTINLNTNASLPAAVQQLADSGLDSIRVSMNSARPAYHRRYYQPRGFDFEDVCNSMTIMKKNGRHVSLNYFILPGFTDDPGEFSAICDLIVHRQPDLIQLRNLNMDPEYYLKAIKFVPEGKPMGMRNWLKKLKKLFPRLRFGYFNPPIH